MVRVKCVPVRIRFKKKGGGYITVIGQKVVRVKRRKK